MELYKFWQHSKTYFKACKAVIRHRHGFSGHIGKDFLCLILIVSSAESRVLQLTLQLMRVMKVLSSGWRHSLFTFSCLCNQKFSTSFPFDVIVSFNHGDWNTFSYSAKFFNISFDIDLKKFLRRAKNSLVKDISLEVNDNTDCHYNVYPSPFDLCRY